MIVTARQLQDMQGRGPEGEQIVLPYGTRLTPLAIDWAKSKRIKIGYGPAEMSQSKSPSGPGTFLWWCDAQCGAAKAALASIARESNLTPVELPNAAAHLVPAIKTIASRLKAQQATGAMLLVKSAAEAIVYANRCPSIRAIVGTCPESIDQGIAAVAANVVIIEYPYKNFSQIRNLLSRFTRGPRTLSAETQQRLEELTSCA
jgi:hypothetical protein